MEFLQCAMAAWIALCSSSMVLLSEEEKAMDVAERRPLLVRDVAVESGADSCALLRHPSRSLPVEWPEKEYGLRWRSGFSFSDRKKKSGSTILAYFLKSRLTWNPLFFFCGFFLRSSSFSPSLFLLLNLPKPKKEDKLLPLAFSLFLPPPPSWSTTASCFWPRSASAWSTVRPRFSKVMSEGRGGLVGEGSRWRGRRWPCRKMSSAGAKSTAEVAVALLLLRVFGAELSGGWKEMVKENS
ncbi:hypothetical protein MUK42_15966 [Musa troglodytarum]|uniref:Secreted protein n=1 Tax=Musa troglodytarum TaxID=320322 RepID=A0A9E7L1V2_9LILI|nr:hypothetical protein MUK42_15966 [Musa troglodytarum]